MALVSTVFSLPAVLPTPSQGQQPIHYAPLLRRDIDFPVRADDLLAARIMAQLKLNLDTNVFAAISATVRFLIYIYHSGVLL
jgi:hypothetical protein